MPHRPSAAPPPALPTPDLPISALRPSDPPTPGPPRGTSIAAWRWPLRLVAPVMVIMLWSQPLLIGLFLGGDFTRLQAHAALGGVITGLMLVQFLAAVPAWRPGGLPGWVVAVAAAMVAGAVVQIAAGYQRNLGLHVPLGVALAAAGLCVAVRAWLPVRPQRRDRDRDRDRDSERDRDRDRGNATPTDQFITGGQP